MSKRLPIWISADLHRKLKLYAVTQNTSMKALTENALMKILPEEEKQAGTIKEKSKYDQMQEEADPYGNEITFN